MRLGRYTVRRHTLLLASILVVALLLRVLLNTPSVFSFWIDEANYANRSTYILDHGGHYDTGALFDHPPLFLYLQAGAFLLFGREWFVARGLAVLLGMLTVLLFYLLGNELGSLRSRTANKPDDAGRGKKKPADPGRMKRKPGGINALASGSPEGPRMGLVLAALFAFQPVFVMVGRQSMMENLLAVLLTASFLAVVRFERTEKNLWFILASFLFALSVITKFTSVVFLAPFGAYYLARRMPRVPVMILSLVVISLIVLPVIWWMMPYGFVGFHLGKAQVGAGAGYVLGGATIDLGHLAAVVMTLVWLNMGLAPFLLHASENRKRLRFDMASVKEWVRGHPVQFSLAMWALLSLLIFSFLVFMTMQYIFTILVPVIILAGMLLRRSPRLLRAVLLVFLVSSVTMVLTARLEASDRTVNYLEGHMAAGDTLVASDPGIFQFYFPQHQVDDASTDSIVNDNATFVVLKTDVSDRLRENATVAGVLGTDYTIVFRTDAGSDQVNFIVFRKVA